MRGYENGLNYFLNLDKLFQRYLYFSVPKRGFCGQELVKGNFILGVAPKTKFLMVF